MSQATVVIPSTGILSGLALVTDVNAALDSLRSNFSGGGAPSADTPETGQLWYDTSTSKLRMHDGSTFVEVGAVSTVNNTFFTLAQNAGQVRYGVSISLASTGDTAIPLVFGAGHTKWRLDSIAFYNPSISLTAAKCGVYTAAALGGTQFVASTFALSDLTSTTAGTAGNYVTASTSLDIYFSSTTNSLFANVSAAQGAGVTVQVSVAIAPLI